MSIFGKLKRGAKAVGRGTKRGVKAAGRGIARGGKFAAKHPLTTALTLGTPFGAVALYRATRGGKKKVGFKGNRKAIAHVRANPEKTKAALASALTNRGLSEEAPQADSEEAEQGLLQESQAEDREAENVEETDDASEDSSAEDDDGAEEAENDDSAGESKMAEYVGWDDIAGDDDMGAEYVGLDEIGVVTKAPKGRPGPNAALVRNKGYNKARRQSMAFVSSGTVGAAASATLQQTAQTLFRGRRFIVASAITASFTIDDVKVGNVSQFAATGAQIADAFANTTIGEDNMLLDTCPPGMSIFITVTNFSGGALTFRGVLFGDSVQ